MSNLVLDSSVVVKWFFPEVDADKARGIASDAVKANLELVVLDIALVEVANAVWKRHRQGLGTVDEAKKLLQSLLVTPLRIERTVDLLPSALEIAVRYDRAVYDALFVAMARALKSTGVTADEPLFNAVNVDFPEIRLLRTM